MKEYIEREAAINAFYITTADGDKAEWCVGVIESLPAADVREVVRGMDIRDTAAGHCEFKCSVCGVELSAVYGGENDFGLDGGYFNFCPNCGADMRQKEET